ncbi:MAG TPA: endonuclease/exonuclease/phosphatase family protein [Ferrovibrio sp.]|jgi:endonuclease/exonuclease/phosphatase family metal-dependent hydrolase|uniref:endonuclease/exonuclease/phosphatase family protein n=1 Tax=Ferrovibrio sp. TaxID=1917215 RepID=UPI002B4B6156|nr:endonuclease/exonuclease/phosphatase family protein [Ferrovibrio sp.]HLT76188.1 endonuclease/exonuclease/phosphatase family protein [Ferrovibrio sp.]
MPPLRVVTYNIHSCVGNDRKYDPARTLAVLKELDADIIALQEVGGYPADGGEQIDFFAEQLGMSAVSGLHLRRRRVQFGNALLAKGEIHVTDQINLSVSRLEPRSAIDAVVETRNGNLRVIATHLGLLPRDRRRQIDLLAAVLQLRVMPLTVLMGDFNVFGRERKVLRRIGAPHPLPVLRSFPSRRPLMSLDRLWTLPNANLLSLAVHRTPLSVVASDHLPLIAEIDPAVAEVAAEDSDDLPAGLPEPAEAWPARYLRWRKASQ